MNRICLVNLPFAAVETPSLALTQIRSVLEEQLGSQVSVEIHYLNLEFARIMGAEQYGRFANSVEAHNHGLGEWFFRGAAFPESSENVDEYFRRYYPRDKEGGAFRQSLLDLRQSARSLLVELIKSRELHRATLVGMTSMFFQNTACIAMAREIKSLNPEVTTVMGGANCESPMGEEIAQRVAAVDFVVSGHALENFPRLVRHLLDGEIDPCHSIPGVFSKLNLSAGSHPGPRGEERPLDAELELDYGSFLEDLDGVFPNGSIEPHLLFETSRGCWWGERAHCTFCGLNGTTMAHRAMSPERALGQFERLFAYHPRCSYFECVDNLMPQNYLREVFPKLPTPAGSRIFYEVKANLTADQLEMLARAGVLRVQAGIESLSSDTLKLMKKGTTGWQNVHFLMNCQRFGIESVWNLLVGFPGEEEQVFEQLAADVPLLTHLPPPTGVYPVRFDRYSPYFVRPEEFGLKLEPYDFYELVYPFPAAALKNVAYYFMDQNFEADYLVALLRWIDTLKEAVADWQQRWSEADAESRPVLQFVGGAGSSVVRDSRSGTVVEVDVGETGRRILDDLGVARAPERMASRLNQVANLEQEIERLSSLGLIFREGGRLLSLVMPAEAPGTPDLNLQEPSARTPPSIERVSREDHRIDGSRTGGAESE